MNTANMVAVGQQFRRSEICVHSRSTKLIINLTFLSSLSINIYIFLGNYIFLLCIWSSHLIQKWCLKSMSSNWRSQPRIYTYACTYNVSIWPGSTSLEHVIHLSIKTCMSACMWVSHQVIFTFIVTFSVPHTSFYI